MLSELPYTSSLSPLPNPSPSLYPHPSFIFPQPSPLLYLLFLTYNYLKSLLGLSFDRVFAVSRSLILFTFSLQFSILCLSSSRSPAAHLFFFSFMFHSLVHLLYFFLIHARRSCYYPVLTHSPFYCTLLIFRRPLQTLSPFTLFSSSPIHHSPNYNLSSLAFFFFPYISSSALP